MLETTVDSRPSWHSGHQTITLVVSLVFLLLVALASRGAWSSNPNFTSVELPSDSQEIGTVAMQAGNGAFDEATARVATAAPWSLHFYAVPGSEGDSLFVSTGRIGELGTSVFVSADTGAAPHRDSHGMTYSEEEQAYSWTFGGFFDPGHSLVEGSIQITTTASATQTQDTGPVGYRRFFVPTTSAPPLVSDDNLLELTLNDHSLPVDAYAIVMSINSPPGPAPTGHSFVGGTYSVRASGAIISSTQAMLLTVVYTPLTLGDVDPHTLSIFAWNPIDGQWYDIGGDLDSVIGQSLTTVTTRFTVYGLMATTHWRDVFNDFTGLSEWDHVTVLLPNGELVLDGLAYTGTATSRAITPTVAIDEWGHVTFASIMAAGTSLAVDVLSADGVLLLSDVMSGTSLASINPTTYPSLKLRATFSTDDLANSASLDEWTITWQPRSCKIYLPIVLRQ